MHGRRSVEYIHAPRSSSENPYMKAPTEPWCVRASTCFTLNVAVRMLVLFFLAANCGQAQVTAPTAMLSIAGIVKSGNTPIPGATVTATNSSTQEKVQTSTDINGGYSLQVAG